VIFSRNTAYDVGLPPKRPERVLAVRVRNSYSKFFKTNSI